METVMIKTSRSYSPEINAALIARGYATTKPNAKGEVKIIIGEAPCRTFNTVDEIISAYTPGQILSNWNGRVSHVLDKESFSNEILAKEGLKEVSKTDVGVSNKYAVDYWNEHGGADDLSGTIKNIKKKTLTFTEVVARMLKVKQSM